MHNIVPGIARLTFLLHLIVAVVLGLLMLVLPGMLVGWWGYDAAPEYHLVIRSLGAAILGLGAVTSYYGYRARSWDQVEGIVRGEIVYLLLQGFVYLLALVQGIAGTPMHVITYAITLVLLVLFVTSWMQRPRVAI